MLQSEEKKELTPDDFLTRAERAKQMTIPQSTPKIIIVPPNNEALGFKYNCYHKEYMDHKIDQKAFLKTIKKANQICEQVWQRKKLEETQEFNKNLKYILFLAIFISLVAFGLLIKAVYYDGSDQVLYISVGLIGFTIILTFFVVIKTMCSQPKFIVLEDTIINMLNILFQEENQKLASIGIQWRIQAKFYWLELHIKNPKIDYQTPMRQIQFDEQNNFSQQSDLYDGN